MIANARISKNHDRYLSCSIWMAGALVSAVQTASAGFESVLGSRQ
jgi:hypothetical protein